MQIQRACLDLSSVWSSASIASLEHSANKFSVKAFALSNLGADCFRGLLCVFCVIQSR